MLMPIARSQELSSRNPAFFDEMRAPDGSIRPAYQQLAFWLDNVPKDVLDYRRKEAEFIFRRIGITFAVYGESASTERLIPFDIIPRVFAAPEWRFLHAAALPTAALFGAH